MGLIGMEKKAPPQTAHLELRKSQLEASMWLAEAALPLFSANPRPEIEVKAGGFLGTPGWGNSHQFFLRPFARNAMEFATAGQRERKEEQSTNQPIGGFGDFGGRRVKEKHSFTRFVQLHAATTGSQNKPASAKMLWLHSPICGAICSGMKVEAKKRG